MCFSFPEKKSSRHPHSYFLRNKNYGLIHKHNGLMRKIIVLSVHEDQVIVIFFVNQITDYTLLYIHYYLNIITDSTS